MVAQRSNGSVGRLPSDVILKQGDVKHIPTRVSEKAGRVTECCKDKSLKNTARKDCCRQNGELSGRRTIWKESRQKEISLAISFTAVKTASEWKKCGVVRLHGGKGRALKLKRKMKNTVHCVQKTKMPLSNVPLTSLITQKCDAFLSSMYFIEGCGRKKSGCIGLKEKTECCCL